jgi:hypothetical protein
MSVHVGAVPDPLPLTPDELIDALPGPSLLHLPGRDHRRARVVSGRAARR